VADYQQYLASVGKRDVARIDIDHEDAVTLQGRKDPLDFGPAAAELVLLFRTPVGEDFSREVGKAIEVGPAKSSTKGRVTTVISSTQSASSY
jgi:hypothetical protein